MSTISRRVGSVAATTFLFILPVLAWSYRQDIFDWSRLRTFKPSASIVQLADKTTMNASGRRLFYVYHPSLEPKQSFNQHCSESEQTIVLGCYVSRKGIFIYDVTDERLTGIEEVTAAHEMLHAAYERLKPQEKQRINSLLKTTFDVLKDERIQATIEQYRLKDPTVVPNELHSIMGTEVSELPEELETYYSRYFTNRSQVVALSRQYERAFDDRRDKVAKHDAKLRELKTEIDASEKVLSSQSQDLASEKTQMEALLAADKIVEYNAMVPVYNREVAAYNSGVAKAKSLIEEYNALVKERNNLVLEENELIKAIDSRPATINSR